MNDLVIIARRQADSEWSLISNPKQSDLKYAYNSYLYNEFNNYVEYENCGIIYRVIRSKDLPKYDGAQA